MKRLKDLIYNTSDGVVALIIILIAGLLIWSRIDAIMAYPTTSDSKPQLTASEKTPDTPNKAGKDKGEVDDPEKTPGNTGTAIAPDGSTPGGLEPGETPAPPSSDVVSFYIGYGETGSDIAEKLTAAKLIKTKEEFYDAIAESNAAKRLQAGTFIIPVGSTPAEIVAIITKA